MHHGGVLCKQYGHIGECGRNNRRVVDAIYRPFIFLRLQSQFYTGRLQALLLTISHLKRASTSCRLMGNWARWLRSLKVHSIQILHSNLLNVMKSPPLICRHGHFLLSRRMRTIHEMLFHLWVMYTYMGYVHLHAFLRTFAYFTFTL